MAFASLTIDLNARIANIERDMGRAAHVAETQSKKMEAAFARAGAGFAAIGGALVGAGLVGFVKQSIDAADNMRDLAIATGTSVDALASYQLAAQQSGTSIEDVSAGMGKLSVFMARNAEEAQKLGLTASDPAQAFAQLADVLARVEDPAQRNAIAAQVLGKSYRELMPLLSQGGDELRSQAAAAPFAKKMGQLAEEADKFNDTMAALKQSASEFGIGFTGFVVTSLNEAFKAAAAANKELGAIDGALVGLGKLGVAGESIAVLWANVQYVFEQVGTEIGGIAAQLGALLSGDFKAAGFIGDAMKKDAAIARKELDDLEKRILGLGQKSAAASKPGAKSAIPKFNAADIIDPKFGDEIAKALDTTALDKFTAKFADTRAKIEAEYAALKQTFGETASGPVTGSDIQQQNIAKARSALAGGDSAAAQAALESGKSRLKELSASGAPAFELNYLADQLKALELQTVKVSEDTATKTRDVLVKSFADINQQIAQIKSPELKINTDLLKQQIDATVAAARAQLAANPLVIPVVAAPNIGSNGALSVDISTAARKLGGSK